MAARALQFYAARLNELDPGLHPTEGPHPERRPSRGARSAAAFATERLVMVASPQQSIDLVASRQPAIVIASSGMATGGRVLHHLAATLPNPKNTVLFVGYQAAGTRGRALVDGAKEVKLKGREVPVAAHIERIDSMSAHADAGEIMRWLSGFTVPPPMTYPRARRAGGALAGARRCGSRTRARLAGSQSQRSPRNGSTCRPAIG